MACTQPSRPPRPHRPHFGRLALWSACLLLALQLQGAEPRTTVLLEIKGAIGPATSDYVVRGIEKAEAVGAELVILALDTPGGLDGAMRDIVQKILASRVAVAGFVRPGGARAASAGTYILYACHIAAMAPATNLGAATPVQIGGPAAPGFPDKRPDASKPSDDGQADKPEAKDAPPEAAQEPGTAMERKMVNDAVAYIRGLAQLRGRNAQWAERAVREAASLSALDALADGVIDLIVDDEQRLLRELDGRAVELASGERRLATAGSEIVRIEPDWRNRLLATITDPNIAYILMLLGVYGLFFELANPGFVLPGVVGAVCLILALFAFQVLPINYAGLGLILLGIAFMVGEAFMPSFGALGIGGLVAFVIGSIILLDADTAGYDISIGLIVSIAVVTLIFILSVIGLALKARKRRIVSGSEALVGSIGEALEDFAHTGRVRVHSEAWAASTDRPLRKGQRTRVVSVEGLRLKVTPVEQE